ncbi:hypothetical protein GCM10011352_11580 [Marinobacterium zhoushanense]|uniref:Phenol 2-monooxygenase P0 subunit n=1 Tax=Marinobacterium zhoushanense TaxID=1679163 RepID=A0ABQ1K5G3_9GAMM|nr:phenol hydroxylase subunit [Marinobacterium zhoushanense]GGB87333.1 hypothetical protein GCM10011352_11580 [Marinobacterium zhoushanense]
MSKPTLSLAGGTATQDRPFDPRIKYVRVRSEPGARFIEFDFAIGDPSLFVELVLPRAAFDKFCEINAVEHMSAEQIAAVDSEMAKWRYGEETLMASNHART